MTDDNKNKALTVLNQDKKAVLNVANGASVSATLEDLAWEAELLNTSWSLMGGAVKNRGRKFNLAIEDGHLWRVARAYEFNDTLKDEEKFIIKDVAIEAMNASLGNEHQEVADFLLDKNFIETYGYNKLTIYYLIRDQYKDILSDLVKKGTIDINAFEQKALYTAAVSSTVHENKCLFILDLGSQYNHALRRLRNGSLTRDNIRMLQNVIEVYEEGNYDLDMVFEKKSNIAKAFKAKSNSSANKEIKEDANWEAVDDNIIVKHALIVSTKTKIQTVFNFTARDVSTIFTFSQDGASKVLMKNFKDVEDDAALYEAWQKLKDAGKNPVPFNGNDNFQVKKSAEKPKLNIKGK